MEAIWTKVETNTDFVKWEKINQSIEGIFIGTDKGINDSVIYNIEIDGVKKKVSGKVLETAFKDIKIGTPVKVVWLGLPHGKKYNDFEVFTGELKK
jgi:uncharacterized OB-fold protein